jgi:S1-C subfamily serine protease
MKPLLESCPHTAGSRSGAQLNRTNEIQTALRLRRIVPRPEIEGVVRSVNGKRVRSVADFEAALAGKAPGSKIALGYIFHSNLGWMGGVEKVLTVDTQND